MSDKKKDYSHTLTDNVVMRKQAEEKALVVEQTTKFSEKSQKNQLVEHELLVHKIELEMQNEELRAAQEEISKMLSRYFDLYELAPVGYCTIDENGMIQEANLTLTTMLDIPRNSFIKYPFTKFIYALDQDIYYKFHKNIVETSNPQSCALRMVKKDLTTLWCSLNITLVVHEDDKKSFRVTISDISKQRQAQDALHESELYYQLVSTATSSGIYAVDSNDICTFVNENALKLLGYQDAKEIIGKHMHNLVHHSNEDGTPLQAKDCPLLQAFLNYEIIHQDDIIWRKDKTFFHATYSSIPQIIDGKVVGLVVSFSDITEKKRYEKNLILSEEQYRLLTTQMELGLALNEMIFDEEGNPSSFRFLNVNDGFERLTGLKREDLIGRNVLDVLPDTEKNLIDTYGRVVTTGEAVKIIKYSETLKRYFSLSVYSPKSGHFAVILDDITEQKLKEKEIEYLSEHDYLTDLYNRRYYFEMFKYLDQPQFYPLGLMMIDVNGLKIVNDAFGHQVGDKGLIMIGSVLKEVFSEKEIISRIGGDEFTVLLPNTSKEALLKYKEILTSLVKTNCIGNIELSLAIGYELKTSMENDLDEIQKIAENQMYAHKSTVGSSSRSKTIKAILSTLTEKYNTERRHSVEVSHLCKKIGMALNLSEEDLKGLEQAGLYHDIGKISIPDSILDKPARLTDEEFDIMKTHTQVGYQILRAADEYSDLAVHALHHHERWDGKGYPSNLKGKDIPFYSRIINVVDAYEAMTADRPYRKKMSKEYAVSELIRCAGTQFDPEIAKLFVEKVLKSKWQENQ